MKCINCGTENPDNANFCQICGSHFKVKSESEDEKNNKKEDDQLTLSKISKFKNYKTKDEALNALSELKDILSPIIDNKYEPSGKTNSSAFISMSIAAVIVGLIVWLMQLLILFIIAGLLRTVFDIKTTFHLFNALTYGFGLLISLLVFLFGFFLTGYFNGSIIGLVGSRSKNRNVKISMFFSLLASIITICDFIGILFIFS